MLTNQADLKSNFFLLGFLKTHAHCYCLFAVIDAPVFVMGPIFPVMGIVEGHDVTLTCKVKADPVELEHLHWYGSRMGLIEKNTTDFYSRF